jgi:hypothetical protein
MDFKNPKVIGGIGAALLSIAVLTLKMSDSVIAPVSENSRQSVDDISFDMKATSAFQIPTPKPAPVAKNKAPAWGTFKASEPTKPAVEGAKTQETLKKLANAVTKKQLDAKKKKKQLTLLKKKRQKKMQELADASKAARAKRFLSEGWAKPREKPTEPAPVVVAVQRPQPKKQESQQEREDVRTYALWRSLVVESANPTETKKLISDFKENKLGSQEWFYQLTKEMLQSRNPEVRTQGVQALDATPSIQSLTLLIAAKESVTESDTQAEIAASLSTYKRDVKRVSILSQGLQSETPAVRFESALLIDESAKVNLAKVLAQRGRGNPTDPDQNFSYFRSIVPVLEGVAGNDTDLQVRQASGQALETIRGFSPSTTASLDDVSQ